VPGKWEPEDLSAYLLVFRGTLDAEDEVIRLFIERIKEALEVPILDDWEVTLWRQARNRKLVQDLVTGGDCILGARIDLQADWQELLTELLSRPRKPETCFGFRRWGVDPMNSSWLQTHVIYWTGFAVHALNIHLGDLGIVPHHI
jgi:hypothetical protein